MQVLVELRDGMIPFSVDDATKKAVKTFVGWNDDKTMPKSVWTSGADPSAMFQSGDVVAYWSGVWQVAAYSESITKFEWASVPTPAARHSRTRALVHSPIARSNANIRKPRKRNSAEIRSSAFVSATSGIVE